MYLITGRISMSLYLFHIPLFYYLDLQLGIGINNRGAWPQKGLIFFFNIVTAVIVGAFFTKFVEEPARNILKSTTNKIKQQPTLG